MVINDLTNPFFAELAVGIERAFQSAGIVPFIANTGESPVRQEEVLKSHASRASPGSSSRRRAAPTAGRCRRIEAGGMPVVFVMRRPAGRLDRRWRPTIIAAPIWPPSI